MRFWPAVVFIAGSGMLWGQQPIPDFPPGTPGEIYYCPRIDLNPPKDGGPLTITLDGALDEPAWQRAAFHGWTEHWKGGQLPQDELDCDPRWAAVADANYLYVAWRIVDESRQAQSAGCGAFNDDAIELYFDGLGDGPGCAGCGYGADDMQLIVGVDNLGKGDPALLGAGMVRAGGCVLTGPADVFQGVVTDLDSADALPGWQGEIAIALENTNGGEWHVQPSHGTVIGWDVHIDDDDVGGGQDASTSALIWSKNDPNSRAWQTPGVWGKLQFVTPDKPLATVSRDIPEGLRNGTSGTVSLKVTPVFGVGVIKISEELPAGLTPSSPSLGGTIAQNTVTWDLGPVNAEVVVTYTLTAGPDVIDIALPGTASIDGEKMKIGGDTTYTGSPYSTLGFIKLWNHLGPLAGGSCDPADPGRDLALDWIVNEGATVTEESIFPFPGMLTRPKYGGDGLPGGTGARSTGLKLSDGRVTRDRFPVWKAGLSPSSTIDHASPQVHGFDAQDHVTMSSVYVTNHTQRPIQTQIGLGSDDSIQVYLGTEPLEPPVYLCRDWGGTDQEQDLLPVVLPAGESRILVKVMDGGGASGFRLRFQDPGDPLAPGLLPPEITVSLESAVKPPPALVTREFSRETYGIGETVDVALKIAARAPNTSIALREIVPALASARDISDGGVFTGGAIEWNLSGVSQKTVTYKVAPASCAGSLSYGQSTWRVGSIEALITGQSALSRTALAEGAFAASWESRDIAYTGGVARPLGDHEALVVGLGEGIKLTEDQFRFVFLRATGDFEFSARIDCMDDPGGNGVGGLMVRDTLDPFSAHAFVGLTPSATADRVGILRGIMRRETNPNRSSSQIPIAQRDVAALPIYLRLKRSGQRITFERSGDGAAWTEVASREIGTGNNQVNLQTNTLVGLAVSSGAGSAASLTFGAVSGPAFTAIDVQPKFRRGDADSSGLIDLSDAIKLLGYLFLGEAKPECLDAADTDDSGEADISDAIANLTYQFLGGPAPVEPGPTTCGPDPGKEEPELGCDKPCA